MIPPLLQTRAPGAECALRFPACPHLPVPARAMDWRDFNAHGSRRDAAFYGTALLYAQYLWRRGLPARAILCLDRAFGAAPDAEAPVLRDWPMPYAALTWFLRELRASRANVFFGNPRVHFQHYAGRMNEPRREQRRWRAWACWAITRAAMPGLPDDPLHVIEEPPLRDIEKRLAREGLPGEAAWWLAALKNTQMAHVEINFS